MRIDEPGANLVDDERRLRVRDARVDLDSAVHRPGVHDELAGADSLGRDPVERAELAQGRHEGRSLVHALALHAQDVDHVRLRRVARRRSRHRTRARRSRAAAASAAR